MLHDRESALEVDRNHIVPLLFGHVENHAVPENSGTGDHNVQSTKIIHGGLNDLLATFHAGDRLLTGDGNTAGLLYLGDHLIGHGIVDAGAVNVDARVHDHHLGPLCRHHHSHAAADPPAGAGYDGDFVR